MHLPHSKGESAMHPAVWHVALFILLLGLLMLVGHRHT
jgi:hypothetical protein